MSDSEYKFATINFVPDAVVQQIVGDFTVTLIKKINMGNVNMNNIIDIILETKNQLCGGDEDVNERVYQIGDYKLSKRDISSIAQCLHDGLKIQAIREFRNATGCSLTEARDAIYYFGPTPAGAQMFLNTVHSISR